MTHEANKADATAAVRVAIGPTDPSGCAGALAAGLRALGAEAEVVIWSPHALGFSADRVLGRAGRTAYALRAPLRRDVFHYQGFTWLPKLADAMLARAFGRTLIANFHGDDCRVYGVARVLFPARGSTGDPALDPVVTRRVQRLARISDAAVVADFELATYVLSHFERVYVAPVPLHDAAAPVPAAREAAGPPVVLHAPSDPKRKGTRLVEEAVGALAARMPLDFRLVTGVTYDVVEGEVSRADVVIDQLNSVNIGVVALEAMRAGLPVLSQLDRRGLAPYQADLPVLAVTSETLGRELEAVLLDPERRRRLGEEGRSYVARVHAPVEVARTMLHVYAHARTAASGLFEATPDGIRPLEREAETIRRRLEEAREARS